MKEKITVITPSGGTTLHSVRELLNNSGILRALAVRDLKIRYAQTALGVLWGILQPLLGLAAVFLLFFRLAGIQTGSTPYLAFALSGLIIWNFFYYIVTQSSSSLINMQAMIRKIYFPKLSIPLSKVIVALVDLAIGLVLLFVTLVYFHVSLSGIWLILPIAVITAIGALGTGLFISAVSLQYRDLQQIIPFLLQILFFLTPVAYPAALLDKLVPASLQYLTYLNPLTGILELWRGFLFDETLSPMIWISVLVSVIIFTAGLIAFTRTERKMADLI